MNALIAATFVLLLPLIGRADCTPTGSCNIDSSMNSIDKDAKDIAAQLKSQATSTDAVEKVDQWSSKRQECNNINSGAQRNCIESCSPAMTAANAAAGQSCSVVNSSFQAAGNASTSASQQQLGGASQMKADCSANQDKCLNTCGDAVKAADAVVASANSTVCPTGASAEEVAKKKVCEDLKSKLIAKAKSDKSGNQTSSAKVDQCKSYDSTMKDLTQLISTLAGLIQQATQQTADTAATAPADCSVDPNTTACICAANSRAPGCPDFESTVPGAQPFTSVSAKQNTDSSSGGSTATDSSGSPVQAAGSGPSGGYGSAGSVAGDSGGAASGSGAVKGNLEASQKSGLSAKILGGSAESGGGGGGSGSGYVYHSPTEAAGRGVATVKAANRGIASQYDSNISGPGGRSNWDKIKERYKDDRASLNRE